MCEKDLSTELNERIESTEEIRSGHELYQDDVSLRVEFKNLNEPQAIALMAMFERMELNGFTGASRWLSFYADGDGPFHPDIDIAVTGKTIAPWVDGFRDLADAAEVDDNKFDSDPVVGWFIDRALDVKDGDDPDV